MAYTKLLTCGPNYAVGYQTVNKASDNVDSQFEAFKLRHGVDERIGLGGFGRPSQSGVRDVGHHDDERISRASVRVTQRTSGGFVVVDVSSNRVISGAVRGSPGSYAFQIRGLSQFWGMVVPVGNGVSIVRTSCKSIYPTGSAPYLLVNIFTGVASGFDTEFTLTIYGNP